MCLKIFNKWKTFEITEQYLSIIELLNTINKLHNYSQKFKYIAEKKDKWKTPIEFMNDGGGDCEDWARWYVDILVRIIKIDGARFIISSGYDFARWGNKIWNVKCHAITVFPYGGKLALFSNREFKTGNREFKTGYDSYIKACKYTFPDGLKYMEIRDWQGKIVSKKSKLMGTF